ncbi:MAG: hypothetical protein QOJ76_3000, partial [Acidobacteriota bacterium]|nr:hypothetical protein [Acidobacteriota bacterium]
LSLNLFRAFNLFFNLPPAQAEKPNAER